MKYLSVSKFLLLVAESAILIIQTNKQNKNKKRYEFISELLWRLSYAILC